MWLNIDVLVKRVDYKSLIVNSQFKYQKTLFFWFCIFGHMIMWKVSLPQCKKIFTSPWCFFPSDIQLSFHYPSLFLSLSLPRCDVSLTPSSCLLRLLCSADIPHSKSRRWGVWDPPHLSGSWHGPHRVRCGVPFRRAVRSRPPQQRRRARQRRGGRRRPLLRLHLCQRLLSGPGAPESGSHVPVRRQRSAGLLTGNGEERKHFESTDCTFFLTILTVLQFVAKYCCA